MPTLTVHREQPTTLDPTWSFGVGTCHAPLWFRPDLQEHLRFVQAEGGFRYVRATGLIGDAMLSRDPSGYGFAGVCDGLQILLDLGYKPFVNLSHMPLLLARSDEAIGAYRFRTSPPESLDKWEQFVSSLAAALLARFGAEELRTWYFEVWHRPDSHFWSGTKEEYFRLYDRTARAMKRADPDLRVGGPASTDLAWVSSFVDHLAQPSVDFGTKDPRCDFVSVQTPIAVAESESFEAQRDELKRLRQKIETLLGKGIELICEASRSNERQVAGGLDSSAGAAALLQSMVQLSEVCHGAIWSDASDIAETHGFALQPFHGGMGLMTVNDVPKASLHATAMLTQITRGSHVSCDIDDTAPGVGALACLDRDHTHVLIYHAANADAGEVSLRLRGLPGATAGVQTIEPGAGSAFETWQQLGSPTFANRELLEQLEQASQPKTASVWTATEQLKLRPGTISLLTGKAS